MELKILKREDHMINPLLRLIFEDSHLKKSYLTQSSEMGNKDCVYIGIKDNNRYIGYGKVNVGETSNKLRYLFIDDAHRRKGYIKSTIDQIANLFQKPISIKIKPQDYYDKYYRRFDRKRLDTTLINLGYQTLNRDEKGNIEYIKYPGTDDLDHKSSPTSPHSEGIR